jgi:hypothetical protein
MSSHVLRVCVRQQWALQSHAAARIVDAGPFTFRLSVFFSESRSTIHATAGTVRNDLGALPSRYRAVVCAPDAPRSRSLRDIVLDWLTRSAVATHVDRQLTELPWPSIPWEYPRFDWTPPIRGQLPGVVGHAMSPETQHARTMARICMRHA